MLPYIAYMDPMGNCTAKRYHEFVISKDSLICHRATVKVHWPPGASTQSRSGHPSEKGGNLKPSTQLTQWMGLRENLQETIDFPIKYGAFL